jgi:hypothetical protein
MSIVMSTLCVFIFLMRFHVSTLCSSKACLLAHVMDICLNLSSLVIQLVTSVDGEFNGGIWCCYVSQYTRYVRKVMRLIFLGQPEGSGSWVSGLEGWWGISGKWSDPAQLPLGLYRVRITCEVDSCLSAVSQIKMQHSVDQWYAIKFCVKLEKSVTETVAMIQKAYGKDALSKSQVFRTETKRQSSERHTTESPRSKKARMSKSKMKSMLIVFFTLKVLSRRSSYNRDR